MSTKQRGQITELPAIAKTKKVLYKFNNKAEATGFVSTFNQLAQGRTQLQQLEQSFRDMCDELEIEGFDPTSSNYEVTEALELVSTTLV